MFTKERKHFSINKVYVKIPNNSWTQTYLDYLKKVQADTVEVTSTSELFSSLQNNKIFQEMCKKIRPQLQISY